MSNIMNDCERLMAPVSTIAIFFIFITILDLQRILTTA